MTDERLGLPSASGYGRLKRCGQSHKREQYYEQEESEESRSGTRIHDWLAGLLPDSALSLRELDTGNLCKILDERSVEFWKKENLSENYMEVREKRLYLREGFRPIFSGQPDHVILDGNGNALILDYKTGFGEQDTGSNNDQLRALSALVHEEFGATRIMAGIVQPGAGMNVLLAVFNEWELIQIRAEIVASLKSESWHAGDHCKWCRAKSTCEKQQQIFSKMANSHLPSSDIRETELPNNVLASLLAQCGNVKKFIGSLEAEAKRRLAEGQAIENDEFEYTLEEKITKRKVDDTLKLAEELQELLAVKPEDILTCCTVRLTDLDTMIRAKTGMKPKELKEWQAKNITAISKGEPLFELTKTKKTDEQNLQN